MKKLCLALAVLIGIPSVSGMYMIYMQRKCEQLISVLEESDTDGENLKKARGMWEKLEKNLAVSANHGIIEEINESFSKAEGWQQLGETNLYLSEIQWLKKLIAHIYEEECPRMYNIM